MDEILRIDSTVVCRSYISQRRMAEEFPMASMGWLRERKNPLSHPARVIPVQSSHRPQQSWSVVKRATHASTEDESCQSYFDSQENYGHTANSRQTKNFEKNTIRFDQTKVRFVGIIGLVRLVFQKRDQCRWDTENNPPEEKKAW